MFKIVVSLATAVATLWVYKGIKDRNMVRSDQINSDEKGRLSLKEISATSSTLPNTHSHRCSGGGSHYTK